LRCLKPLSESDGGERSKLSPSDSRHAAIGAVVHANEGVISTRHIVAHREKHTMKTSRVVRILFAGLTVGTLYATSALAELISGYPDNVEAYDPREVSMLPRYCIYTQSFRDKVPGGNDKAEIDRWYASLGPGFHAMHHFCWGLMKTNRALLRARTNEVKTFYLRSAIDEFNYVITNSPADFVMLPEILMRKGQNLIALGKGSLGVAELERAIELKPDYWAPYAVLSDYYKSTGDATKARELIEKGLAFAPDNKGLRMRLEELDKFKAKKGESQRSRSGEK